MNQKNKQEQYREYFNKVDPVGIFFEENVDEYDPEIKELLASSVDTKDLKALKEELLVIFRKYFDGLEINENRLKELAFLIQKNSIKD